MLTKFNSRSKAKSYPGISFVRPYCVVSVFWKLSNAPSYVVKRRMRTIPNMFVASLAVSDLFIGVFSAGPLAIPTLVTSHWPFNDTTCQFQGYLASALYFALIHTLVLMAVNRYYRIVKPTKYRHYFTKKKTLIMILVTWFYSICAPLIYVLLGNKMVFHPSKVLCCIPIKNSAFLAYGIPLYIGIPTCVIIYFYLRIFTTVRHHNSNFHLHDNPISLVHVEEVKVTQE